MGQSIATDKVTKSDDRRCCKDFSFKCLKPPVFLQLNSRNDEKFKTLIVFNPNIQMNQKVPVLIPVQNNALFQRRRQQVCNSCRVSIDSTERNQTELKSQ